MNIEGVVIFESKSGIPLFYKMPGNTDPSLFASFITAARHFSTELSLGGLSSFATDEKVIFMAQGKRTVTVLITPKSQEFQETLEFAAEVGDVFESIYDIPERPQPHEFTGFRPKIEEMLRRVKDPFINRVAQFAHKQYGGEISIKARLTKRNGETGIIDIMVNHVHSKEESDVRDFEEMIVQNLAQDYTFIKAIDDIASRGEVIDFLDSVDHYGTRLIKRDEVKFLPYFPKRAVIVARDFAEDVMDFISRLPTDEEGPYIDGAHVMTGIKIRGTKSDMRCHVELWKWKDNGYPKRFIPAAETAANSITV